MLQKIKGVGAFLIFAGVVSAVLSFVDYELRILMWIDAWGTGIGWAIRGALVVVGLAVTFLIPDAAESRAT
jgi:hypothetical protein